MSLAAGLVLCGALTGADYGTTVYALRQPDVVEVGPVARHGLAYGASAKMGLCSAGEIAIRHKSKRVKWLYRGVNILVTGYLVVNNLRVAGQAKNAHR